MIKWTLAAGAALGVCKGKIVEILEQTAGRETAFAAAESTSTRSVHIVGDNGGLAWFTQLFPIPAIATSTNGLVSYATPNVGAMATGTDNAYWLGKNTPWVDLPAALQATCFLAGTSQAHVQNGAQQSVSVLGANNIFAFATALQASSPSVVPVIAVSGVGIGSAPGSAQPTAVVSSTDIVNLFNSAASRAGGLLAKSNDATTYAVQYAAFAQLNRASQRSTQKIGYRTAIGAAGLLGTNLEAQLRIDTTADYARYGVTAGDVKELPIAQALIIAVKAFRMGLTNSIVLPAMSDDPHSAFSDGRVNTVPGKLKGILDAFMKDLKASTDSVTGQVLSDDTVITVTGDTPKDVTNHAQGDWTDGTPGGANQVFVYSAGHLKSGWFGSTSAAGVVTGYGADGKPAAFNNANTAKYALASIAYAIAKGDERAIAPFANGTTISGNFGRPKQL
ncbi:hypothetical protein BH11MYX1_BH11MYX1_30100 [soil metagenome]